MKHRPLLTFSLKVSSQQPFGTTVLLAAALAAPAFAQAGEVSFRKAFDTASRQDVMVIAIPESDVLVMEPGSYFTEGKRLVIVAARMRLEGETRIGFYPGDSKPALVPGVGPVGKNGAAGANKNCSRSGCRGDDGGVGGTGATGSSGNPGATILLDVTSVSGGGRLELVAAGQSGGKGQRGGNGGTGGKGGNGAQISCGAGVLASAGDGGQGGTGGAGGRGGAGGSGGAGGVITVSAELAGAIRAGTVTTNLAPARGGPGGDPGVAGAGGDAGSLGSGGYCGGGGRSGLVGGTGLPGALGRSGVTGSAGGLRYWTGNEAYATEVSPRVIVQRLSFTSAGLLRDCHEHLKVSLQVLVPPGQTLVSVEPPRLVSSQGALGLIEQPFIQPLPGADGQYGLSAVFARARAIDLQKASLQVKTRTWGIPSVEFMVPTTCPAFKAEFDVAMGVVPAASALGAKLKPLP